MGNSLLMLLFFILVGLMSTMNNFLLSQTSSNPFEIKPRLEQLSDIDPQTFLQVENIDGDTLDLSAQDTSLTLVETLNQNDKSSEKIINPFDVDHVPLRKTASEQNTESAVTPSKPQKENNNFLFWYLLLATILLAIVINTNIKIISHVTRSITNDNILKLFRREQMDRLSPSILIMYLIFFINLSVFIYLMGNYWGGRLSTFSFLTIIIIVVGYYLFRHIGLSGIGALFKVSKATSMFSFTIMVTNLFLGLVLLPSNFILAFGVENIQVIIIAFILVSIVLVLVIRVLRGVLIVSEYIYTHFFQIFIYLCAFEIAPALILVKFLLNSQVIP